MDRYMVLKGGSQAIHKLGDIGRDEDDIIRVFEEDDKYYIGQFEEGFGFVDVKFRKEDCRKINRKEFNRLNKSVFAINGQPLFKICVDKNGDVI